MFLSLGINKAGVCLELALKRALSTSAVTLRYWEGRLEGDGPWVQGHLDPTPGCSQPAGLRDARRHKGRGLPGDPLFWLMIHNNPCVWGEDKIRSVFCSTRRSNSCFFSTSMHPDSKVLEHTLGRAGLLQAHEENGAPQLKGQRGRVQENKGANAYE